jgi:serine/threonine protein kinase
MYRLLIITIACFFNFGVGCYADAELEPSQHEGSILQTICSPTECYTITKELGNGAFGRVYAVEDSKGQKFALKTYMIEMEKVFEGHIFLDLEREFSRGQMLDHPNIIRSYDFFLST